MNRLFWLLVIAALVLGTGDAFAQSPTALCVPTGNGNGCQTVDTNLPLPVGTANQVTSTLTVQNAAYVSGNCVGGFNAVTVADYVGQSGFVINYRVVSAAGATPTLTLYLFDSNPSASTCTDRSTFTLNSADIDKLIAVPTSLSLAAPTGTTSTLGSIDFIPPRPFRAGGVSTSGVKTIYYALVSGSSFTPAATTDLHVRVGVARN